MYCPYCKSKETKVIDKRDNHDTNTTRRRRECETCEKRFTTYERIENVLLYVKKRDGTIEEFDREKLKRSALKALGKRGILEDKIDEMIDSIEKELMQMEKEIIQSKDIGQVVLENLYELDELAALLFAAVYKEFNSLEDVKEELRKISVKRKKK